MKSLKITLLAIFSIALLTAVAQSDETNQNAETSNHEVRKSKVKLTAFKERKGKSVPTQG